MRHVAGGRCNYAECIRHQLRGCVANRLNYACLRPAFHDEQLCGGQYCCWLQLGSDVSMRNDNKCHETTLSETVADFLTRLPIRSFITSSLLHFSYAMYICYSI